MRRLQIGMWEQFSPERWEQLAMPLINGMEVCCLPDRTALSQVRDFCRQHGLGYGIHGPVLAEDGYRLPVLNAPDPRQFQEELQYIASEVELASAYGADYILFHYPFYPVFQEPFTPYPRLPDIGHRYSYEQLARERFRDISLTLFEHLAELQMRFKQRIVLEHDFFGDYGDILIDTFLAYPEIRFVLDTARLDIAHRAFAGFDPYSFLEALAPQIDLVHYSNVRYDGGTFKHHLPVLPEHDDDERFGGAYAYLEYVAARNQQFHITFEHDARLVNGQQLDAIYRRTAALLEVKVHLSHSSRPRPLSG
ncbi:sugar phosphate isomerase/epimerase family protein [Paenibacillus ihbetae]|nr:sugar phosphate isomerase/epimerase [Paenibacillus ihbetae]